jgi:hypothetical protein
MSGRPCAQGKKFARRAAMRKMAHRIASQRNGPALRRRGDPGTAAWQATAFTLD